MRHGRFAAVGLALVVGLLAIGRAEALELASGPLRVFAGNEIVCAAGNAGAENIAKAVVTLHFRTPSGTSNGDFAQSCGTLSPSETCQQNSAGGGTDYAAFCEITYPGGKLRGTMCNVTLRLCSEAD
jgi:hypothetical protein